MSEPAVFHLAMSVVFLIFGLGSAALLSMCIEDARSTGDLVPWLIGIAAAIFTAAMAVAVALSLIWAAT